MSNFERKRILVKMTGSIAAFKACALISKLVQAGHHVKIVASPGALQFIGPATIEGLTGEKVASDLWEPGRAMEHIHLMRWADLIVVTPASAHFINRVANGVGDDLLTTMFLAHDFKKPYLIAPAMNTSMYLHPVTQKSIAALKSMGCEILEAASGVLACGEVGYGRLLEPELLLQEIETRLKTATTLQNARSAPAPRPPLKVLITAGGTQEPIDGVRVLSNSSTGATGSEIADRLESLGFSVVLLHAHSAVTPRCECEKLRFTTSADLTEALRSRLSRGDVFAVIHLAAVSDFVLSSWEQAGVRHPASSGGKISSRQDLDLHLVRNRKILPQIRAMSPRPLHLTAFKMTSHAGPAQAHEAVSRVFEEGLPDWVVHNDTSQIDRERGTHVLTLYKGSSADAAATILDRAGLVESLVQEYASLAFDTENRRTP